MNTPFKRWVKCNHCLTMFSTKASLTRHLKRSSCKEESRDIDSLSYLSLNEIKEAIYGSKTRKKSETSSEVPQVSNIMTVTDKIHLVENAEGSEGPEKFQDTAEQDCRLSTHQRQLHLCPVCGKQFSYRSSLVSHQMIHQKLPKCHNCTLCSAAFTTIRSLRRHQYTHCDNRDKEFICEYCGKRFAYALTLKNHRLSHSEERPHSCRICGTSFKRISHLRAHEQGVHNLNDRCQPKNYTCGICQKGMVKKESLEAHMKEHTGELNYKCNDCHKKFATNTGLNIHISMARCEHYIKSCNVCQLEFKADEPICEHLKTKSMSKKPRKTKDDELRSIAKTNAAGKKYKVPRHLKERNYFCKICGKDYIYPCELKTHFRLAHTDEKPFVCGQCGKAFKAKASLQMHEDVHNDHRPHECTICQKRFRKTEHLKLHVRTHTGEKPHICEVCGRGFTQKGDMKKHLLKTHKKSAPQQQQQ